MTRLVLLPIALIVAACGSGAQPPAPTAVSSVSASAASSPVSAALDPCALLTPADVQPLVGTVTGQRVEGSCTYPFGRAGGVSLSILPGKDRFVEAQGYPGAASVSAVGDQAVYVAGLGELWFVKNGQSFSVKAIGLNVPVTLDLVRPLALKVLARM
jgi:hypothetical protein